MRAYLGPDYRSAQLAYERARAAGMSELRARVVAHVASFKDGWVFRRRLAAAVRCSVRTVQRALSQAVELGLLGRARARRGETPPGAKGPLSCGWSHRWMVARDLVGAAANRLIMAARLKALTKCLTPKARRAETEDDLEQRRQAAQRALAELELTWARDG